MTKLGLNTKIEFRSLIRLGKSAEILPQKDNHQSNPFMPTFKAALQSDVFQGSKQSINSQSFLSQARSYSDKAISNFQSKYSQAVTFAGNMKNKISDHVMSVMPQSMRVKYLSQKSVSELGNMLSANA